MNDHIPSGLGAVDRVDSGAGSESDSDSVHSTSAVQSEASTRDALALDFPLPEMPASSGWPAYGGRFNWVDMRVFARAAVLADRESREGDLLAALRRLVAIDDAHATIHAPDGDDIARMLEYAAAFDNARAAIAAATGGKTA